MNSSDLQIAPALLFGGQPIRLEIDGGVKPDNIARIGRIARAGADTFVAGSAVFGSPDPDGSYRTVIARLRKQACAPLD